MDPELELLMMQMAANQYGSGPDYMSSETNPYARPQQRLNYWQDIEQLIGVPLTQLAGVGAAPVDPAEAPDIFQSDLGTAYGGNPVFADAFELIQGGVDPYKAMAAVRAKYDAGEYGDEGLVPQKLDEFTGQSTVDWDEVGGVIQQYATDNARTQRETEQYATENSATYNQAAPDGARYKNAPLGGNDPFAFASEADLYDWDAIQSEFNRQGNEYAKSVGPTTRNPEQDFGSMYGARNPDPFASDPDTMNPKQRAAYRREQGNSTFAGAKPGVVGKDAYNNDVLLEVGSVGRRVNVNDRKGRGAFDPIKQDKFEGNKAQRKFDQKRATAGANARNQDEGDYFKKSLQANLTNRRNRANQTAVRSDANTNTMKRLMAAYALIHGELPG